MMEKYFLKHYRSKVVDTLFFPTRTTNLQNVTVKHTTCYTKILSSTIIFNTDKNKCFEHQISILE